jgi:hypothetical protein
LGSCTTGAFHPVASSSSTSTLCMPSRGLGTQPVKPIARRPNLTLASYQARRPRSPEDPLLVFAAVHDCLGGGGTIYGDGDRPLADASHPLRHLSWSCRCPLDDEAMSETGSTRSAGTAAAIDSHQGIDTSGAPQNAFASTGPYRAAGDGGISRLESVVRKLHADCIEAERKVVCEEQAAKDLLPQLAAQMSEQGTALGLDLLDVRTNDQSLAAQNTHTLGCLRTATHSFSDTQREYWPRRIGWSVCVCAVSVSTRRCCRMPGSRSRMLGVVRKRRCELRKRPREWRSGRRERDSGRKTRSGTTREWLARSKELCTRHDTCSHAL